MAAVPESYLRHRADATSMFEASLHQLHPDIRIRDVISQQVGNLCIDGMDYAIDNRPVWVIGAGKAAHTMAASIESVLGNTIHSGIVITQAGVHFSSDRIRHLAGDHPLPSDASLAASLELERIILEIPEQALVIALISGGASSIVTLPPIGVHIDDVAMTVQALLKSGAGISDINTVRRHLCQLKGGQLARMLKAQHLVSLIYSDVPGDRLHDIGSGMTVPDPTSFEDAIRVLDRIGLRHEIPASVVRHLENGAQGFYPENPKSQSDIGSEHQAVLLGSSAMLADQVAVHARQMGYMAHVYHPAYDTSVRVQAHEIATRVRECIQKTDRRQVLIFHGEGRVHVTGRGKGGRNQELALLVLLALEEISVPWTLMSIGTDGIDGNTDAAGAFVFNGLLPMARHVGYSPEGYLLDNDSYHFFEATDTLIRTGPTGNNLTDLQILIIEP